MTRLGALAALLASAVALHAPASPRAGELDAARLAGRQWYVAWVKGADAVPGTTGSLSFGEGGQLVGTSGCNRLRGDYSLATPEGRLEVGEVALTRMLCPEEIMRYERAIVSALKEADKLEIAEDGSLRLTVGSEPLLVMK